ncbi:MAG: YdiU family protein, partial [Pseudomonadota bacterium]
GDGRALLVGEVIDSQGHRRDIQLKGSGRTPFSRGGDGKAPLAAVLREFVVSEAMAALGIPTTRSLAAVATGEDVLRESVLPGGVLTRVAASHIRIGTFQYFYARQDTEALQALTDHVIARHYPEAAAADVPALALLEQVMERQANLVARWMGVGFIHGVMNTDNMTLSGETIDYGPCAFMDTYRESEVFSSIDTGGRYAFANQPTIAQWNLAQLAQSLLPLIPGEGNTPVEKAQAAIDRFPDMYQRAWIAVMGEKLGLSHPKPQDADLISALLAAMEAGQADFTLVFRQLTDLADPSVGESPHVRNRFVEPTAFDAWKDRWQARLTDDPLAPAERRAMMRAANPLFTPRNHRIEGALTAAVNGDLHPIERLRNVLARPFDDQPDAAALAKPPSPEEVVTATFCGT